MRALSECFLGNSPEWYKLTILAFLVLNPILFAIDGYIAGWILVIEFIFTLAMALRCYPLQPGGLLAFEAVAIGMTSPSTVYQETVNAFEVILLLIFMVAGIFFLKNLLLFTFTKLVIRFRSKIVLSLLFSGVAAVLSAFLDALTVTAVVITVASGFYGVYHRVASGKHFHHRDHDSSADEGVHDLHREDLVQFRAFLRSLVMHAAVGTALGGVTTLVGEPQNLLIATVAGWEFIEFFMRMAHVSLPVLAVGLVTCALLEHFRWFGYGVRLPEPVRHVLEDFDRAETEKRTANDRAILVVQALVAVFLVIALAFHWAAVGHDRSGRDRPRDGLRGSHRRAQARPCVPGSSAVYGSTGRVLRDRRRHPRSEPLPADRRRRARITARSSAADVLRRERSSVGHQR